MTSAVLTVDDSASLRMAIRIALTGAGYNVTEACDGLDGLAKASAARFDLIVTDLNMPNMDGLQMIRELRKQPAQAGDRKHRTTNCRIDVCQRSDATRSGNRRCRRCQRNPL